jgi:hypothetical protein
VQDFLDEIPPGLAEFNSTFVPNLAEDENSAQLKRSRNRGAANGP